MNDLAATLKAMKDIPILVVGDLMLDRFIYGDVNRISPESPVPVLSITREEEMLGGAGNVVCNLAALGAKPFIFAVVGNDDNAKRVLDIAKNIGAMTDGILVDKDRPTTIKTRYLARHQQLLRSDFEKIHALSPELETALFDSIQQAMKTAKAIVLSDYGKGVLSTSLIAKIIKAAKQYNIPVLVDPKGADYSRYRGAEIVTPNRKELGEAAGRNNLKQDDEIVSAANKIIQDCGINFVVATRSEDGLSVISMNDDVTHLPTQAREIFDVSGAGDTVIATLAAAMAAGAKIVSAAKLANIAAGIAVSKVGTAPVRLDEILNALDGVPDDQTKILDETQALEQIRKWRTKGMKIGFTNGCFDILHKGHVTYLAQARAECDRLIVAINHDVSVKILKGATRPINDQEARAVVMGALSSVDMVVFFGATQAGQDNTPCALVEKFQPDLYFKGGDYNPDTLPESKIVAVYGGQVRIMPFQEGYSTTSIIQKNGSR